MNGFNNALLNFNPNLNPANGAGATNPFRLDRSQAVTADQDHDYTAEQIGFDMGAMDLFPKSMGTAGPPPSGGGIVDTTGLTMGYFDGNTITALWNYAQDYAMSDNSYSRTFGPSTPGVINLVSGQTNGAVKTLNGTGDEVNGGRRLADHDRRPGPTRRCLLQHDAGPRADGWKKHWRSANRGWCHLGRDSWVVST